MATKQSKEYKKGMVAFDQDWPSDTNPYERQKGSSYSNQRQHWCDGWYDQRIGKRLGHIFKRHGIVWP